MTKNDVNSGLEDTTVSVILKVIPLFLFIILGISSNVLLIFAVIKNKKFHKPPYYYALCLSLSELSRNVFCLPFMITTVLHQRWIYGKPVCIMAAFANYFFTFSSTFTLFLLAVDRSVAVIHGQYYARCFKGLTCLILTVLAWTSAFLLAFPPIFGLGAYQFVPLESQCSLRHTFITDNNTIGYTIIFMAIMLAVLILYIRVFAYARKHRKMRPLAPRPAISTNWNFFGMGANLPSINGYGFGQGANRGVPGQDPRVVIPTETQTLTVHSNEHLTRMFFAATAIFDILWAPYLCTVFWFITVEDHSQIPAVLVTIATWLTYLQSSITPTVYFVINKHFRKTFLESFKFSKVNSSVAQCEEHEMVETN